MNDVLAGSAGLGEVKGIDRSENYRLDDVEWLDRELGHAAPGRESALMRLLLSRVTLNNMFQFSALLDTQGRMWDVNYAALRGGGLSRSDIHGRPFWQARWWQTSAETVAQLRAAITRAAAGEFVRYDVDVIGREGSELITIDFDIAPVKDRDGNVRFLICEGRDVTEQRRLEAEVRRQREELAQLDQLKTQFFANVSHEFRTPLTLMLGPAADALADGDEVLGPRQRQRIALLQRNGQRLLKLVNTLLDFSRIEAGRAQAVYQPIDLPALTADLASNFRTLMEKAGLHFTVDCHALPQPVYVDRDMWEKIVLNLLSNAFKFTLDGTVALQLQAADGAVRLTVRDTGLGMPAEALPHIFERFHRVEGTRGRSHEGSGIGLALVQELVRLHGGSIAVESQPGEGSVFTVTVPLGAAHLANERIGPASPLASTATAAEAYLKEALRWLPGEDAVLPPAPDQPPAFASAATAAALPAAGGRPPRVVVADDNGDMRDYLRRLLADAGYAVEAVVDGRAALAAVRREPPDLLLTDVMMPDLDGFALLREVRGDPATMTVPVLLLSARAGEEARVEGLDAGADDYLVKPFTARELLARVRANVALARMRRDTEQQRSERRVQEMREELSHVARLSEMGQMAAALAHEINQPLTAAANYASGLQRIVARGDPAALELAKSVADRINEQMLRAGDIIRRLREFMTKAKSERCPESIVTLIEDANGLALVGARERDVDTRLRLADDLPLVFVDKVQVQQVLVNIIRNAVEAMEASPRREIVVEAMPSGDTLVAIAITDTGPGIAPGIADRLFQPFVSTKAKGMGVGLSLCRHIVEAHGGRLWVEPNPAGGTVFRFTLPVFDGAASRKLARNHRPRQ